jgi:hypothetical protein
MRDALPQRTFPRPQHLESHSAAEGGRAQRKTSDIASVIDRPLFRWDPGQSEGEATQIDRIESFARGTYAVVDRRRKYSRRRFQEATFSRKTSPQVGDDIEGGCGQVPVVWSCGIVPDASGRLKHPQKHLVDEVVDVHRPQPRDAKRPQTPPNQDPHWMPVMMVERRQRGGIASSISINWEMHDRFECLPMQAAVRCGDCSGDVA